MAISSVFDPALAPSLAPAPAPAPDDPAMTRLMEDIARASPGTMPLPPPPPANVPAAGPTSNPLRDAAYDQLAALNQAPAAPAVAQPTAPTIQDTAQAALAKAGPQKPAPTYISTVAQNQLAQSAPKPRGPPAFGAGRDTTGVAPIPKMGSQAWSEGMQRTALEDQQAAEREAAENAILYGRLTAEKRDQIAQGIEDRQKKRDADRAERASYVDGKMAQLQSQIDEARNIHLDSGGRIFGGLGGPLMAMGAALGAGAASRVTGRNEGQAALDNALTRSFNEQKANADLKQSGVQNQYNLVSQMRQIYSDRDTADLAAEAAYRELAAAQIMAIAERSKVPELVTNAQKLAAGQMAEKAALEDKFRIKHEQDAARLQAARNAAEKVQWDRAIEVAKLRNEGRKTDAEIAKMGAEAGKQDAQDAKDLANKIAEKGGVAESQATIDEAQAGLTKAGTVWNTNPVSNAFAVSHPLIYKFVAGDDAAAAQMAYAKFKTVIMNTFAGSAVSEQEGQRILSAIEGAGTPAARQEALTQASRAIDRKRAALEAAAGDKAVETVRRRTEARSPIYGKDATELAGFKPGVK